MKTIDDIKKQMKEYKDFFGGELLDFHDIDKAETKQELSAIIDRHYSFLEAQCNDAQHALERFHREIIPFNERDY
jgi:hypothetical protein